MQNEGSGTPKLLPPSTFEVGKVSDPWEQLAKLTSEVIELKQQNIKLKEERHTGITLPITCVGGEEIKARVDVHQSGSESKLQEQVGIRHLDEIISRQAAEIGELRKKLSENETNHQRECIQLQTQLNLEKMQHTQKFAGIEQQLITLKHSHQLQVDEMMREKEAEIKHYQTERLELQDQLAILEQRMCTTVLQLETTLKETTQQLKTEQTTINSQEQIISEQQEKMQQLKNYYSKAIDVAQSTEVSREELANLRLQLDNADKEKRSTDASMQLLNIRLSSQNEILCTHESEISRAKDSTTDMKKYCLLTRWREKVYKLLVQLKCQELVLKDEERKWREENTALVETLLSEKSKCQMLELAFADKQAQLDLQIHRTNEIEKEFTVAQQLSLSLDDQLKTQQSSMQMMTTFVNRMWETYAERQEDLNKALGTLRAYNQRLTFASGRFDILKSQFARKEALLRIHLKEQIHSEQPTRDTTQDHQPLDSDLYGQISGELDKVTAERDQLAEQVAEYSGLIELYQENAQKKYADEVEQLKIRLEELHGEFDAKSERCETLSAQVDLAHSQIADCNEMIDKLKADLENVRSEADKDLRATRATDEAKCSEQIAEMDHRLNETRREHTKTVVSLRQQERAAARERERASEAIKSLEEHNQSKLRKMQQQLKQTETDRNLLMATLRQEGLVGKYKAQREEPIQLGEQATIELDCTGSSVPSSAVQMAQSQQRYTGQSKDDEPLHAVIDDLKSLTAAILEDEEAT